MLNKLDNNQFSNHQKFYNEDLQGAEYILHLNIHSLELHIEELRIVLKLLEFDFDIICLTETKLKKNVAPKSDISIESYQYPVGTPTEASKGGVLIFVKEGIDYIPSARRRPRYIQVKRA